MFCIHYLLPPMNLIAALVAQALKLTKSPIEIDALLLYAAKTNHPFIVEAALRAGADVHVCDDQPLRSASYAGFSNTAKILLRSYKLPEDRNILHKIRTEAKRFDNPSIDGMLGIRLGQMQASAPSL